MRRIIFVGNCQMHALYDLYMRLVGAHAHEKTFYIPSYEALHSESAELVAGADVIVEQVFDVQPTADLGSVPTSAERLLVPVVSAGFLWPFTGEAHPKNEATPAFPGGPYPAELGDRFLNRQIAAAAHVDCAVERYLSANIARIGNLDRRFELAIDGQRRRDVRCGYQIANLVLDHFQNEQVFRTPNHPGLRVLRSLAAQLFERLGAPVSAIRSLYDAVRTSTLPADELPIHPGVIEHFRLTHVTVDTDYGLRGEGRFTFREFCDRYMSYTWGQGIYRGIHLIETDPVEAHSLLSEAVERFPGSPAACVGLFHVLRRLGDDQRSEEVLRRAIELEPDNSALHHELGSLLLSRGEAGLALTEAGLAVYHDPANPHCHDLLGSVLTARGSPGQALKSVERAAAIEPENAGFQDHLSRALAAVGQIDAAVAPARMAAQIGHNNPHYHLNLANLLGSIGDLAGREVSLRAMVAARPGDPHLLNLLGHFLASLGRHEDAAAVFSGSVVLDPENVGTYLALARALDLLGSTEEALATARRAGAIEPENAECRLLVASLTTARGERSSGDRAGDELDGDAGTTEKVGQNELS